MVAQASRLCCEQSIFSLTGETPVPLLWSFKSLAVIFPTLGGPASLRSVNLEHVLRSINLDVGEL
jgi:hypothetical protein